MKRKINGIVTIPVGLGQRDEMKIDSPEYKIIGASQKETDVSGVVTVGLDMIYYWKQGSLDKSIQVTQPFLWDDLSDEQKTLIGQMIIQGHKLAKTLPGHADSTEV